MADMTRRNLFGLAGLIPLATAGIALGQEKNPAQAAASEEGPITVPKLMPELEPGVKPGPLASHKPSLNPREQAQQKYFPEVEVLTHEGKKVSFYKDLIKGKIVTINFIYTHCDEICPLVTANLVRVQQTLGDRVGKDIFMYSFSLQGQDSPKTLAAYREKYKVKPGWTFLTGNRDTMELLRRKLGFTYPDPKVDADKDQHIGNIRFGSEPLVIWEVMPGMGNPRYLSQLLTLVERRQQGHPANGREIFNSAVRG
jgi:protein SCO1/2